MLNFIIIMAYYGNFVFVLCAVFEENYCTIGQRTYSEYALLQFKIHFEYQSHRERLFVLFHD